MFLFGKRKKDEVMTEEIAMSALMKLMAENDILEIELLIDGKLLKIGVSSDHDQRKKPAFFDKRYYIEDSEYSSADSFSRAFSQLSSRTMQTVVRIDGVEPRFYHFDR